MAADTSHRGRTARAARTVVALVAVAAALGGSAGCSQRNKALGEVRDAYESGHYDEAIALCRHAIRRHLDVPRVYYYYGAALVSQNRDFEAFSEFDEAVARSPELAGEVGKFLFDRGVKAAAAGDRNDAAARIRKAVEIDPARDPGPYGFMVADLYFNDKDYAHAARRYESAIAAYPDTAAVEQALFRLAVSHVETGAVARGSEEFREVLDRYPRSSDAADARWRLANLTYDDAEKQYTLGNYDDAVTALQSLIELTDNLGLLQRTRFLLGETYEAMGQFRKAYDAYRDVINEDRGASGRIVDRAQAKIAALEEAGFH